jgi:hypothetical protein|tara:strand:- start:746 stop:988 length:243 start_codon:yes stop_codon:yes gene_type:complete
MKLSILLLAVLSLSCKSVAYTPEDCAADLELANLLVVAVLNEEIDDEAKVRKAELYATIVARVAARGCALVPEPMPALDE